MSEKERIRKLESENNRLTQQIKMLKAALMKEFGDPTLSSDKVGTETMVMMIRSLGLKARQLDEELEKK
jgi:hypothetical protein